MARFRPFLPVGLALGALLLAPVLPAQEKGAGKKKDKAALPVLLETWSRALREAGKRLAPSLMRLDVWESPFAPPSRATGVVVRPGVVVTTREAVEGSDLVLGEIRGNGGYSLHLRLRRFSGPLAVLEYAPSASLKLKPVQPGNPSRLPHGSMVLLAQAGDPGLPPGVFLLPLFRMKILPGKGGKKWEGTLHLEGFYPGEAAQGALVCDTSFRMVGLLRPRPRGGFFPFPGPGPNGPPSLVIPASRVLSAVDRAIKEKVRGRLQREKPFTFGVVLLPGMVLEHVILGSPAQKAGLKKGDRITQFDGVPVETLSAFQKVFSRSTAGKKKNVLVEVERKGRKLLVEVRFP